MPTLAFFMLVFVSVGSFFLFIHLMMGKFIRPSRPEEEKSAIYECGEPTVGSAWIQFDLRYYVVALLFVVFDVEVAFFFPWAVVFGDVNKLALSYLPEKERTVLSGELAPPAIVNAPAVASTINPDTAKSWAWISLSDILVFFGVLMVGFAYLWRRGDIDWVRSLRASDPLETREPIPVLLEEQAMVEVGAH